MDHRILPLLLVICIVAACGGAPQADPADVATLVAEQMQTLEAANPTAAPPPTDAPTADPAPAADAAPVVVFIPPGLFSDADREEIMRKVVDPFVHYYRDLVADGHPKLVSIAIESYTGDPAWRYGADAIFEGEVYISWLLPVTGGVLDWWIPECMNVCEVSDSFRAAYPEIMAIIEP
jgi:hypothetical protein